MMFLALLSMVPVETVAREQCDLVERNFYYDDEGRLVFTQFIFYDWSPCFERFQVRAWRLQKDANQVPQRDWSRGGYVTIWQDGEIVREVRAAMVRETWTQFDPELAERAVLPKEYRKELTPAARPR